MLYDKINIMLPSYKRLDKLKKFLDSAIETCDSTQNLVVTFCVNENDPETMAFILAYGLPFEFQILTENTKQPNLALYYNMMYDAEKFKQANIVVSMVGDDMVFQTKRWDTKILKTINDADGKAIVYCDDGYIAHESLAVQVFTTRLVVDATRKPFMCPMYHADMIDVVWTNVGLLTGTLKYLGDVVIKHEHESAKKDQSFDDTFRRMMPLRKLANEKESRMYGWRYAHLCAANLVDAGIGEWSTL